MQIMGLTEEGPDLTSAGAGGTLHINEASLEQPNALSNILIHLP